MANKQEGFSDQERGEDKKLGKRQPQKPRYSRDDNEVSLECTISALQGYTSAGWCNKVKTQRSQSKEELKE